MPLQTMISPEDVAQFLGVSLPTVRRWLRTGMLKGHRVGGRWRFNVADIERAVATGQLAINRDKTHRRGPTTEHSMVSSWAQPYVAKWRDFLFNIVQRIRPKHFILLDRRGARLFALFGPQEYEWGNTLWHSMAIDWMTPEELREHFEGKAVVIFDEMIQRGRRMETLRETLHRAGARVHTVALVRRKRLADEGDLHDMQVMVCEDLDERAFGERAALLSRLLRLVHPPLDVDHLVIRYKLSTGWTLKSFLDALSRLGTPFVVSDEGQGTDCIAVTLDRPQFFDIFQLTWPAGCSGQWSAPCKLRFYLYPEKSYCDCSFIALPTIKGDSEAWAALVRKATPLSSLDSSVELSDSQIKHAYTTVSLLLSVEMFRQFDLICEDLDVRAVSPMGEKALDKGVFVATYGPRVAGDLLKALHDAMTNHTHMSASRSMARASVPLLLTPLQVPFSSAIAPLDVRKALLENVPRESDSTPSAGGAQAPVTYQELFERLSKYPEPAVGQTLDRELDLGTMRPDFRITRRITESHQMIEVSRAFWRGEYFGYADWAQHVMTDEDLTIRRTLGVAFEAVSLFLRWTNAKDRQLQATRFAKLFANLALDWRLWNEYPLYLSTRPEKYGLVPTVPQSRYGRIEYDSLSHFLVKHGCLVTTEIPHGEREWTRFLLPEDSEIDWHGIHLQTSDALARAMVSGLVKVYAAVQNDCRPVLPSSGRSEVETAFSNPLTMLGAVRNRRVAYICGYLEVANWIHEGNYFLFPLLKNIALARARAPKQGVLFDRLDPAEPRVRMALGVFSEPAKLLETKLEMYRTMPSLRQKIETICAERGLEFGAVLLDTVDAAADFSQDEPFPIGNLIEAARIMRPFSSMLRQVLTRYNLHKDLRVPHKRVDMETLEEKTAEYYLDQWLEVCPALSHLRGPLQGVIDSGGHQPFDTKAISVLHSAFEDVVRILERVDFLPRPAAAVHASSGTVSDAFLTLAAKTRISSGGGVIVIEVKNLQNLAFFLMDNSKGRLTYDEALDSLIDSVATEIQAEAHGPVVFDGVDGDTFVCTADTADAAAGFAEAVQRRLVRVFTAVDRNQLAALALVVVGASWYQEGLGKSYEGRLPALCALRLAEHSGFLPGTIAITGAVARRLSTPTVQQFADWKGLSPEERGAYQLSVKEISLGRHDQDGIYVRQLRTELIDGHGRYKQ